MSRSSKLFALLAFVALSSPAVLVRAAPPAGGLQTNSLEIESRGGRRYRPQRPTVSPYLALTPGGLGNLSAINYFNVVQPELVQMQINQQQNSELLKLEGRGPGAIGQAEEEEVVIPRERAGYMTHHKYFGQPINRSLNQSQSAQGSQARTGR